MEYVTVNFLKCELLGNWTIQSEDSFWLRLIHDGNSDGRIGILTYFDDANHKQELVTNYINLKPSSEILMSNIAICYRKEDIK